MAMMRYWLLLPLTLKWAAAAGVSTPAALHKVTGCAARLLGLDSGVLAIGAPADLCIFDPAAFWAVTPQTLRSQGKNTPYLRREMQARVERVRPKSAKVNLVVVESVAGSAVGLVALVADLAVSAAVWAG